MGKNFMVDKSGILIASGAKFVGTITASAGRIASWDISGNTLTKNNAYSLEGYLKNKLIEKKSINFKNNYTGF